MESTTTHVMPNPRVGNGLASGNLDTCTRDQLEENNAKSLLTLHGNATTFPEMHSKYLSSYACESQKEYCYNPTLVLHERVHSILGKRDNDSLYDASHESCPLIVNGEQPLTDMGTISHSGADEKPPEMLPEPANVQLSAETSLHHTPDVPTRIATHEGAAGTEGVDEPSKGLDSTTAPVNLQSSKVQGLGTAGNNEGIPSLSFSNEETKLLADKIGYAIIGKFSHVIPSPHQIQKSLASIPFVNGFKWKSMNAKHIIIQFRDESDYARMLNGPNGVPVWYIDNHPMRVFKWTPDFDTFFESPIAAVWCKVIGLPINLYDQSALIAIGKLLGKPMIADHATINQTRLTFARICVEIDISHPPPEEIILNILGKETRHQVVWERIPTYCVECKHVGHVQDDCLTLGKKKPSTKDHNHAPRPRRHNSRSNHIRREWRPKGFKDDNPSHQSDIIMVNKEKIDRVHPEETKETDASTSRKRDAESSAPRASNQSQPSAGDDGFQLVTRKRKDKAHEGDKYIKAQHIDNLHMKANVVTVSFEIDNSSANEPGICSMSVSCGPPNREMEGFVEELDPGGTVPCGGIPIAGLN